MKKFFIVTCLLISSLDIFAQLEKGMISVGISSSFKYGKSTNEYNYTTASPGYYNFSATRKSSTFNIAPSASYFLSNRFAIGIQIGYIGYSNTIDYTYKYKTPSITDNSSYEKSSSVGFDINPYVKYYIPLSDSGNVLFFVKGGIGFQNSRGKISGFDQTTNYDAFGNVTSSVQNNEYGPNKTKTSVVNFGISPGILYMPIQKIGIEFTLGNLIGVSSTTSNSTDSNGNTSKVTSSDLEYFNFNTLSVGTGIYYFFK